MCALPPLAEIIKYFVRKQPENIISDRREKSKDISEEKEEEEEEEQIELIC
jgi:hypothetical protein